MTRDQFLTEAMGCKWHQFSHAEKGPLGDLQVCVCDRKNYLMPCDTPTFSTWQGFGKLWEWAQVQDWWDEYVEDTTGIGDPSLIDVDQIEPARFADAVYRFLKERE